MGSQIACHLANAGLEVLLLDILPPDNQLPRNHIADKSLAAALKTNPSPLYLSQFASRITTGNFEDHLPLIASCDWVIEAVVEKLEIKKSLFACLEPYRKPGTIISSNTSGIPIRLISEGRSDDFRKHFCGTHFFNPPRYLKLLEIIPGPDTDPVVIEFLMAYGEKFLGKTTVTAKDTPAFIGNRIGVFSIMQLLHLMQDSDYTVPEIDRLTGIVIGRPKSASFRTNDMVGLDTVALVANGLVVHAQEDEAQHIFRIPAFITRMIENGWIGNKAGQGFYKKEQTHGDTSYLALNLHTFEYQEAEQVNIPSLEAAKQISNLPERLQMLTTATDRAGEFYRKTFYPLFAYASHRIPEIASYLYQIDEAMKAGYNWQYGPFEIWDALGLADTVKKMEAANIYPAHWVYTMVENGCTAFYMKTDGKQLFYDLTTNSYLPLPGSGHFIRLDNLRDQHTVWKNSGTTITDIGDCILHLEFHTKMNTIGAEILEGIQQAIALAEKNYQGLVISNEGENFSVGANVGLIFMMASAQEFEELDMAIRQFQQTMMRIRYAGIPIVAAPHHMALGGGCELCMHADKVVAHAELYMGLVETGIGLIPGGGGTKEFALRLSDELHEGDIALNTFRHRLLTIGQAKVSTSAHEAFELGYLRKGTDIVVMSRHRLLAEAKKQCLMLAESGYTRPIPRSNIRVLGKQSLGLSYAGANSMLSGHYISEHDLKVSQQLAYVLSGGDLSEPSWVSEQYLLDMERHAFLALAAERKTLERMQSLLKSGNILRN